MTPRMFVMGALASLASASVVTAPVLQAQDLAPTPEQQAADQEYLRVLPRADGTNTARAKTENMPYRRCDKDPFVASKAFNAATKDAYAQRMIYAYVQNKRVVETGDCGCQGKVAPFDEVLRIIDDIEARDGLGWSRSDVGQDFFNRSQPLLVQAEEICGGDF